MTPYQPPLHAFREYDIRGYVDTDLNDDFAYRLGRAFGELITETDPSSNAPIAIGWDCRLSSPGYAQALAKGISERGVSVELTGMGPTPQLYYALFSRTYRGGIQVTGSHNPADMNGFKISLGQHILSRAHIQELAKKVASDNGEIAPVCAAISEHPIQEEYTKMLIDNSLPHMGSRKLKVVVDAGNGVGGMVGPAALRALGVDVIEMFCEPDGRFPNHHPDPTVIENVKMLGDRVRQEKADFGIGWDGDADRIGVVDETGTAIFGDMLLILYGRALLKEKPGATIIGDVKCSSLLFNDIASRGGNPVMWKTGHGLIKAKLREVGADIAGEMSGHIFFKHRFYGFDDAIYASLRFAEIVSHAEGSVSSLLTDLPKTVSTPEIRVDCPEEIKFKVAEAAKSAFSEYKTETLDGVRIEFAHGWGLVRASNTQSILVMRFEATSEELLQEYQELTQSRVSKIIGELEASLS